MNINLRDVIATALALFGGLSDFNSFDIPYWVYLVLWFVYVVLWVRNKEVNIKKID